MRSPRRSFTALIVVCLIFTLSQVPACMAQAADGPAPSRSLVYQNGWPMLRMPDGQLRPPLILFANTEGKYWPDNIPQEIAMARDAGIHLYSFPMHGPWEYHQGTGDKPENFTKQIEKYVKPFLQDPQGCWMPRIHLSRQHKKRWEIWAKDHPGNLITLASGKHIYLPSLASEAWWSRSVESLTTIIRHLEDNYGSKVFGYHVDFWGENNYWGYAKGYDFSDVTVAAFRKWLREKYHSNANLRKAWNNPGVTFSNAGPPAWPSASDVDTDVTFVDPAKNRDHLDYCQFHNWMVARRICELGKIVKDLTKGRKLTVFFHGYLMQISGSLTGHWDIEQLFASPYVDAMAAPMAYNWRQPGGAMPSVGPISSYEFNRKLWFNEDDENTFLRSPKNPRQEYLASPRFTTVEAILQSHARNFGYLLAQGAGTWWMDLWGDGALKHPAIWKQAGKFKSIMADMIRDNSREGFVRDVAVFVDNKSMYHLAARHGQRIGIPLLNQLRNSLYRMGTNTGFYMLSDLTNERFPLAKAYIFLNAFSIDGPTRKAIEKHINRKGILAIWIWSPPVFDDEGWNIQQARELTGLNIQVDKNRSVIAKIVLTYTTRTEPRFSPQVVEYPLDRFGSAGYLSPRQQSTPVIYVKPDDHTLVLGRYWNSFVKGRYSADDLPAFVWREDPRIKNINVYVGATDIPPGIFRGLLKTAGVHIYDDRPDVVHVGPGFVVIHATGDGVREISWPGPAGRVTDVLTDKTFDTADGRLVVKMKNGQTLILKTMRK